MPIREYKPTSPGRRFGSVSDFAELTTRKPEKSLLEPQKKSGGRNASGKIMVRHRGGGNRQHFRRIDFRRNKSDIPAKVATIEYDPNRSSRIALLHYRDGEKRYILAPKGLKVGMEVVSGERVPPEVGNCMPLEHIPAGMPIHNVELRPGAGACMVRSAGASAVISAKEGGQAHITLPSGEIRRVPLACRATIGQVGNVEHSGVQLGKAGRRRHRGFRPTVRGTAQNPVDHPMGGGEGRTSGGRHPVSPTGKLAKGGKTRKRRLPSNKHIVRRRRVKRSRR